MIRCKRIMKGRKRKKNLKRKDIIKETQNPLGESQYKPIKIVESFDVIYVEYDSDGDLYFLQFLPWQTQINSRD